MHVLILTYFLFILCAATLHVPSHSDVYKSLSDYPRSHPYTRANQFDRRDGWEDVGVSNLDYKYTHSNSTEDASQALYSRNALVGRSRKPKGKEDSVGGAVKNVVDATLRGIGKIEEVTITWYTGKDLLNPSCWQKSVWAPTDNSFACAVTLEGWIDRPKCFTFLELCNDTNKCIFVRVVDTCAGCAKGSKHVDLTKAAFKALANLDVGTLQVKMRLATDPKNWLEDLWGPKNI